jgi:excisionase family DNA binding protein
MVLVELVSKSCERKMITINEAAFMLAVSPLTIRRAIKNGKIKAMQLNRKGRYRISINEINELMRKNN